MTTRRAFVQKTALGAAGLTLGAKGMATAFNARSYSKILGANDKIRVGIVGYSDRFRGALSPAFLSLAKELNFEFTAVSDLWSLRREAAAGFYKDKGIDLRLARNNDELWNGKDTDAVFVSTPDFSHALVTADAVKAGRDVYCEKPFAETMADARYTRKAVEESGKIVQIGSQRRSAPNYIAANEYLKSGKFGKIVMVEMSWNVNQPGRWRRPDVVPLLKEADTDWKRYQQNRPLLNLIQGNTLNSDSSGHIPQESPGNGWPTRSIQYIGLQVSLIPTALLPTEAFTCGRMAGPTKIQ